MSKPELLLPVGNVESFYAAIKGGADAVYVGLKSFNARGRAANFNPYQFQLLMQEAKQHNIKVYVTLNTVIKNKEIPELLDTLWFLRKMKVAAVIIQDWGTYYLIKNYFPELKIHASTQMANHNSLGTKFSKKLAFERIILARELTHPELESIQQNTPVETEIFVHGALCYSFSGMCLFSSYLGGAGANRGLCAQPCRRFYEVDKNKKLVFSLKDNQLIDFVPQFAKLGVSSLKVEGRIKSGEYVYQVARAYRMAIDNPETIPEAKKLLSMDMGRPKTQWFFGKDVANAVSINPNTGVFIGKVKEAATDYLVLGTQFNIQKGNRLRIRTSADSEQLAFKVNEFKVLENGNTQIFTTTKGVRDGNEVFLAGLRQEKFPSKLKGDAKKFQSQMPFKLKKDIQSKLRRHKPTKKSMIYVRVDSLDWLRKIRLEDVDHLVINLSFTQWPEFNPDVPFLKKNQHKIWFEFPSFISEKDIKTYKQWAIKLTQKGYRQFSLSHLSQKELLPPNAQFGTNENVYCYNDAAALQIKHEKAQWVTSPFENEFDNLLSGANRSQLIPMHFYPKLFFSRQPVKISENGLTDDQQQNYHKTVRNGMTVILPDKPVSLFQYTSKLINKGFNQFLIDLSFEKPSKHTLKRLLKKLRNSEQDQPSTTFNFKKGLK